MMKSSSLLKPKIQFDLVNSLGASKLLLVVVYRTCLQRGELNQAILTKAGAPGSTLKKIDPFFIGW
jgi:hypothetical protein